MREQNTHNFSLMKSTSWPGRSAAAPQKDFQFLSFLAKKKGILDGRLNSNSLFFLKVHGVSFKKRAPRAIKEIRAFTEQAMVRSARKCFRLNRLLTIPGHQGCPPRPPVEQEGLGIWYQGRRLPPPCPHQPQA